MVATTSSRALALLSVLSTGAVQSSAGLVARLRVTERTVRRDVETLRALGYRIEAVNGERRRVPAGTGSATASARLR